MEETSLASFGLPEIFTLLKEEIELCFQIRETNIIIGKAIDETINCEDIKLLDARTIRKISELVNDINVVQQAILQVYQTNIEIIKSLQQSMSVNDIETEKMLKYFYRNKEIFRMTDRSFNGSLQMLDAIETATGKSRKPERKQVIGNRILLSNYLQELSNIREKKRSLNRDEMERKLIFKEPDKEPEEKTPTKEQPNAQLDEKNFYLPKEELKEDVRNDEFEREKHTTEKEEDQLNNREVKIRIRSVSLPTCEQARRLRPQKNMRANVDWFWLKNAARNPTNVQIMTTEGISFEGKPVSDKNGIIKPFVIFETLDDKKIPQNSTFSMCGYTFEAVSETEAILVGALRRAPFNYSNNMGNKYIGSNANEIVTLWRRNEIERQCDKDGFITVQLRD